MAADEQGKAGIPPEEEPEREDRAEAERQVAAEHERATSRDPHHPLTNPAQGADETEYPDPYEERRDPRDPAAVDTPASPADPEVVEGHDPPPQDPSTSEPPPPRNIDRARRGEGEAE